jgi:hypothetical protein
MSQTTRPALLAATAMLLLPTWALAHEGHGTSGAHWHATDAWGFVMLAVVFAAGVWWSRRK